MATFWKIAAHSVYNMFSLYLIFFVILVTSHFGFEGGTLFLIAPVPGHCLPFTFCYLTGPLFFVLVSVSMLCSHYVNVSVLIKFSQKPNVLP